MKPITITTIEPKLPKLELGGFLETVDGKLYLRRPNKCLLMPDGTYRVTRTWIPPVGSGFDQDIYEARNCNA